MLVRGEIPLSRIIKLGIKGQSKFIIELNGTVYILLLLLFIYSQQRNMYLRIPKRMPIVGFIRSNNI